MSAPHYNYYSSLTQINTQKNTQKHTYTYPYNIKNLDLTKKSLFALNKNTNKCLGKEGRMSRHSFYFIVKNSMIKILILVKNTTEVIYLKTCYLLEATWWRILKRYDSMMILKQLSLSNTRLVSKTSVKVFCPTNWLIPLSQ